MNARKRSGVGQPKGKPLYKRWWAIVLYVLVGLMILGSLTDEEDIATDTAATPTPTATPEATPTPTPTPEAPASPTEAETSNPEKTTKATLGASEPEPTPGGDGGLGAGDEPLGATVDGTWAGGQVPYGQSYDFFAYTFQVAGPPSLTKDANGAQVESEFSVTRFGEVGEYDPPIGDGYAFTFVPGSNPSKIYGTDYGEANWDCDRSRLREEESTTCHLSFEAEDAEEVENFYWTIEDISFGAWPSQDTELADRHEWVELARISGISRSTNTEPVNTDGQVRVRYEFAFEAASGYIYGELTLESAEGGECGARESTRRQLADADGVEHFGYRFGPMCANFHPPDPNWDRGNMTLVLEELN